MKNYAKQKGELLDTLLLHHPDVTKTTLRSWIKNKRVWINGTLAIKANTPISEGDNIEIKAKKTLLNYDVEVLYRDEHLVVIDKPAGLLSVATDFESQKTAHSSLKREFGRVFVVHRLDQETSGVMMFAFDFDTLQGLKALFANHDIERKYIAIVDGHLKTKKGQWKSYLIEDSNYYVRTTNDPKKGELAVTDFQVIKESKTKTMLELKLQTGKKNQIRVHCQDGEHPIVGDVKYNGRQYKRLLLHASKLGFFHPKTKKKLVFVSPLPEIFNQTVK